MEVLGFLALLFVVYALISKCIGSDRVSVRGYKRRDGTTVRPHKRRKSRG